MEDKKTLQQISDQFSLSHTNEMVLIAISRNFLMGIDIENIYREINAMEIARSYFSPDEVVFLDKKSMDQKQIDFFKLWTLKEAYIKAKGLGLSLPLNQFSFSFNESIR